MWNCRVCSNTPFAALFGFGSSEDDNKKKKKRTGSQAQDTSSFSNSEVRQSPPSTPPQWLCIHVTLDRNELCLIGVSKHCQPSIFVNICQKKTIRKGSSQPCAPARPWVGGVCVSAFDSGKNPRRQQIPEDFSVQPSAREESDHM